MKNLYTENDKTLMKENEDSNQWKDIHVHRSKELKLLKWLYFPKPSIDSMHFYQNFNGIFHRNRKNNPKIHMKPQKTPNSQNNLEKEQSWRHQYITKL